VTAQRHSFPVASYCNHAGLIRLGEIASKAQADNARLRALFPDVDAVALRDGLHATVDWFRSLPDYTP